MSSETQEQLPAMRGQSVHPRPHGKGAAQSSMRVTVAFYGRQLELNSETLFGLGQLPEARGQSFQPGSFFRISFCSGLG